jgi:polyphosphate kinase 2 (PPK2 family)
MILAKFWIHISQEEQLRRFEARRDTPYKAWKLTDDDWRNREKWDRYEEAVEDMLLRTSTLTAPWTIVEGNDKWFARVKSLRTLVELLSRELDYSPIKGAKAKKGEGKVAKKGKKGKKKKKKGKKKKKKGK